MNWLTLVRSKDVKLRKLLEFRQYKHATQLLILEQLPNIRNKNEVIRFKDEFYDFEKFTIHKINGEHVYKLDKGRAQVYVKLYHGEIPNTHLYKVVKIVGKKVLIEVSE